MKTILNIFSLVSVFFHELAHIIALVVVGVGVRRINIERLKNFDFSVVVLGKEEGSLTKTKVFIVAFAPVAVIIVFGVLAIFSKIALGLFVYTLLNLRFGRALPSKIDIATFKNFEVDVEEEIVEIV